MKPKEIEELEGKPGHRKPNENSPSPDTDIPPPPRWLGHIATRAYHDLVELVGPEGMRVMGAGDKMALVMVCEAFEEWRKCKKKLVLGEIAEAAIKRDPAMRTLMVDPYSFEYMNGGVSRYYTSIKAGTITTKRHPIVGDMQNAWGRIMKGLGQFGLTPYTRQKVAVVIGKEVKVVSREDEVAKKRQEIKDRVLKLQKQKVG